MRYFLHEASQIDIDGKITMVIRNGDHTISVGEWFGMAKILKLEAYGKELSEFGPGLTGRVTFDRMPLFSVMESSPGGCEEFDRLWPHRKGHASNATE